MTTTGAEAGAQGTAAAGVLGATDGTTKNLVAKPESPDANGEPPAAASEVKPKHRRVRAGKAPKLSRTDALARAAKIKQAVIETTQAASKMHRASAGIEDEDLTDKCRDFMVVLADKLGDLE